MKKVYFISGLGADMSVFENLDLSFCEPVFLDWIPPLKKESLQHYALRLAERISEPNATIVGLSMGGMMATEIVKAHPRMKAIIISSNATSKEFPLYTRLAIKYLPLYKLASRWSVMLFFPIQAWIMGAKTKEQKKAFKTVLQKSDLSFVKWCIRAIGTWKQEDAVSNVIHIHGTADKLLPYRFVHAHHIIQKGEHLMIRYQSKEINELLKKLC